MAKKITPKKAVRKKPTQKNTEPLTIHVKQARNYASIIEFIKRDFKGTGSTPMPSCILPMLATKATKPFNHPEWIFEIKWDGYRSIAYLKGGEVEVRSRKNQFYNDDYPEIIQALKAWPITAVVDGEIAVLDEEGKPDFEGLQKWKRTKKGEIVYCVFDILWLDGLNLMEAPLHTRKEILKQLAPDEGPIRFSDSIEEVGVGFFAAAKESGLEGIVAKHKDSFYYPGKRTKLWLKMPTEKRREFVIGGWTESDSGRPFKSLIFGYYHGPNFVYVGHAGGGYKDNDMPGILNEVKKLEIRKKPFSNDVPADSTIHWTKPLLVAEFKFASFTSSGNIRKPAIFLSFRKDKNPREVVAEVEAAPPEIETTQPRKPAGKAKTTASDSNWPYVELEPITSQEVRTFDGKKVIITNPQKTLWKGIAKNDLLLYYQFVSVFILPHLRDRPLSLHIKHQGPFAEGFYIKDMEGREPNWAQTLRVKREHPKAGKRDIIDYLICNDEATLQYVVNLGCIDLNPWTARVQAPRSPDYIIIDLDPSDDDFAKVIEAARAAKRYFDHKKILAFPKTSGKTGMHLYLPCQGFDFKQARRIAENVCGELHRIVPSFTTTEVGVKLRGSKLYLDPNQNDYADTVAAPYSVRPFKEPTVSTPLEWREVTARLNPRQFTLHTMARRLEKKGDLFQGVLVEANRLRNQQPLSSLL